MKVPMSWINDYTDISGVSPKEYAHAMTMTGSKVENIENLGENIQNVVTGKILSVVPHENSDHLQICMVDVGNETLQIVTGAPNVKAGQIVPVAKHMSKLPGGVVIKKGKLRGVESCGMLCSHDELGLSAADLGYEPEHGILILPEDTQIGIDIRDYFGLNEDVVEFEITSNRPDCFSVIGLARETAVTFGKALDIKQPAYTENGEDIRDYIAVDVKNSEKCPRYSAKMVKNVKIGPSPKWLSARLRACGIRSINNIVDITNYVLLEYGQPMHAFDLRDLSGGKIIVRTAEEGETIKTLDGIERKPDKNTLLIADAEKAVAIAGVMGGFNSEVKNDTTAIVFESATFDAASVRLAAQKVGLRTEASSRYEKGLDPNNTVPALERACELVEMLGAGEVVGGMIDIYTEPKARKVHAFRPDKINEFLGVDIPATVMADYLDSLEFEVDMNAMTVVPPSFRPDIESEADIAEEIARIYGYDKIPTTLLSGEAVKGGKTTIQLARDKVMKILTAQGMNEIYTYTFTSPTIFDKLNIPADSTLRNTTIITNPLGEDTSVMRTTMLSSMLEVLSRNYNRRAEAARLFEVGKVYIPTQKGALPEEREKICLGMYGADTDFYDIKGVCEALFEHMSVKNIKFSPLTDNPTFHPGRTAKVLVNGENLGVIGQVHPNVCEKYEIDVSCYLAEMDFDILFRNIAQEKKYKALPKFPAVTRDIAMLADDGVAVSDIEEVIVRSAGSLLDAVKLFDVYKGKQIPEGKKSVAYSVSFRASDRTLTDEEANAVFDMILKSLKTELGVELR
ncbi:MAG: phenylalanine--tRNA ligase subunit beta [Clostridia bacterium]|nr:phenylalanine--tRNA ligase subunit beta [Clostridia bacterium]